MDVIRAVIGAATVRAVACVLTLAAIFGLHAAPARAQLGGPDRYAAIVIDHRTGQTLHAANADDPRYPASLTKMMTLYMLFEAIRDGRVQMSTPIVMSAEAASRPPSKLGIPPGMSITAEQAILALVTKSANDVAAAVAEHLGGTEERFGQMMTLRARSIGMTRSTFRNASGLPDFDQTTTARDMTTLGRRLLLDFPSHYHYFGTVHANIGRIRLRNHNRMLDSYEGADGIKTGYTRDSGFNIVTSAERNNIRLVGAVFGGRSWVERDQQMAMLLDQGFERLGVAPRAAAPVMAAAPRTGIMGTAAAATVASAPVTRQTPSALGRPATRSAAVVAAPQRPARGATLAQGSRAGSPPVRTASARSAPPPVATRAPPPARTATNLAPASTTRQRRG